MSSHAFFLPSFFFFFFLIPHVVLFLNGKSICFGDASGGRLGSGSSTTDVGLAANPVGTYAQINLTGRLAQVAVGVTHTW